MDLVIKIVSVVMWLACLCFLVLIGFVIGMYHGEMVTGDWVMMAVCGASTMWFSFIFIKRAIKG